jgi:hypothetical protein
VTDRITVRPDIYHGQACVMGTRIPVFEIVRMPANGDTVEYLVQECPTSGARTSSRAWTMPPLSSNSSRRRPWRIGTIAGRDGCRVVKVLADETIAHRVCKNPGIPSP